MRNQPRTTLSARPNYDTITFTLTKELACYTTAYKQVKKIAAVSTTKTTSTVKTKDRTIQPKKIDAEALKKEYNSNVKMAEADLKLANVAYDACKDKVKCRIANEDARAKVRTIFGTITTSDRSSSYKDCTLGTFDYRTSTTVVIVNKATTEQKFTVNVKIYKADVSESAISAKAGNSTNKTKGAVALKAIFVSALLVLGYAF